MTGESENSTEDHRHLATGVRIALVLAIPLVALVGLAAAGMSLLVLAFGFDAPGARWTFDLLVVVQTPVHAILIGSAAAFSLALNSLRPIIAAMSFAAFSIALTALMT